MSAGKSTADKSTNATEWLVYRLGGPKAMLLGHVTAADEKTALAKAFEEFGIAPAERKRIIVQPTSRA